MDKAEQKIKDALYVILQTKRIDETNVSKICKNAKVSRTAFYAHFKDKFDVAENIMRDIFVYADESPLYFSRFIKKCGELSTKHNAFFKNTIYHLSQNSLENAMATIIADRLIQILYDNGWKREDDPFDLCFTACTAFAHLLTRLYCVRITGHTYETPKIPLDRSHPSLENIEIVKALVPVSLAKYFF